MTGHPLLELAALMVEKWNRAAQRLYRAPGMRYRTLSAAAVSSRG